MPFLLCYSIFSHNELKESLNLCEKQCRTPRSPALRLETIARVLLEQETLDRPAFEEIMDGRMTAAPTPAAFGEYDDRPQA